MRFNTQLHSLWFPRQVLLVIAILALSAACQPVQPVEGTNATPDTTVPAVSAIAEKSTAETSTPITDTTATEILSVTVPIATPDSVLVEAGVEVYHAQYCGICHTLSAASTTGTFGPVHDGVANTAAERVKEPRYSGSANSPAEYVYESIVDPKAYIVEGYVGSSHSMPPYTHLSEDEVQALVAFLMTQAR